MKRKFLFLATLGVGTLPIISKAAPPAPPAGATSGTSTTSAASQTDAVTAAIAKSYIDGNVPSAEKFEALLRRDLTAYFTKLAGKPVVVRYEPLRRGPTQSGVSYPKYYLWVTLFQKEKPIGAGAVRVAAIDKKMTSFPRHSGCSWFRSVSTSRIARAG